MAGAVANLDWLFWLLGGLLAAAGVALGAWALFWDRANRGGVVRRRCPKCWYDMERVPGLMCPECGRSATSERKLAATRRRWRWATLAGAIALGGTALFAAPFYRGDDWVQHVPSSLLVWIAPAAAPGTSAQTSLNAAATLARIQSSGLPWNTALAQRLASPAAPPKPLGERFDNEVWCRLLKGGLARWQSQTFLDRYFRKPAAGPWSLDFPERWPVQRPVPVRLSRSAGAPFPSTIMIELSIGDRAPKGHFTRYHLRNGFATLLEGPARPGRDNRLQVRLWLADRIIYATSESLPVEVVPGPEDLMVPVGTREMTEAVRAGLSARLGDGDPPALLLHHTSTAALGDDLAVVVRAEVIVGAQVVAHSRWWVTLFNDHRVSPRVVPMNWLPGALDLVRASPDPVVRIYGDQELATLVYYQSPYDRPAARRCWEGEITIPAMLPGEGTTEDLGPTRGVGR